MRDERGNPWTEEGRMKKVPAAMVERIRRVEGRRREVSCLISLHRWNFFTQITKSMS